MVSVTVRDEILSSEVSREDSSLSGNDDVLMGATEGPVDDADWVSVKVWRVKSVSVTVRVVGRSAEGVGEERL